MKKKNGLLRSMLAVALTLAMASGLASVALAADQTALPTATITAEKVFAVDNAANIDKLTSATFTLSRHFYSGGPAGTTMTKDTMPLPTATTVTVSTFTKAADNLSKIGAAAFGAIEYSVPGVYTYKLVETVGTPVAGVTYDKVERFVNVYVENVTNAAGDVTLNDDGTPWVKVAYITVWKNENFTDVPGGTDTTDNANKESVTEGDGANGTAKVTFTNTFGNTDKTRLEVSKTVKGTTGDTKKEFTFTFATSNNAATNPLAYQVFDSSNAAVTGDGKTGTIVTGGTFKLKHGEYVRIYGMADSATYTVTEGDKEGYKTSITGSANGAVISVAEAAEVTTAGEKTYTTANVDTQAFVNSKGYTPPTGVVMDILPFALMMLIAAAGAAIFFARKRRDGGR